MVDSCKSCKRNWQPVCCCALIGEPDYKAIPNYLVQSGARQVPAKRYVFRSGSPSMGVGPEIWDGWKWTSSFGVSI